MKRRHFLLSGSASAALALTGCGGGGTDAGTLSTASAGTTALASRSQRIAATATGPGYAFGARLVAYPYGIRPTQSNATMDAVLTKQYDAWKAARIVSAGSVVAGGYADQFANTAYLTVSEGMGYAMLLAVLFAGHDPNAQQLFNGLLSVVRTRYAYAVVPYDPNGKYLMEWRLNADGSSGGQGWNAMDGDLDIAMALLMADKQWGSTGTWNYLQEGKNTIAGLKSWCMAADGTTKGLANPGVSRTSDYMIGHFRAFQAATGDSFWSTAIDRAYYLSNLMQTSFSAGVGLMPDFIVATNTTSPYPSPGYMGDGNSYENDYWWNACRNPWRYASDYLLSGDSRWKTVTGRIVSFFQSQVNAAAGDVTVIGTGYGLAGNKITGGNDSAYMAPIMLGGCIDASYQTLVDALWNWNAAHPTTGYYDSELQLLSMVVAAGNWWSPLNVTATGTSSSTSTTTTTNTTTSTATTTTAVANVLANGDFSSGLTGWSNWGNAAVVNGALNVGTAAGGVGQDVWSKLTAGTTYQLTGTANVTVAGTEGVFVGVKLFSSTGALLLDKTQLVSATSATAVSLSFTMPSGVASGYVYVWKNANTAIGVVDNLVLTAATATTTTSSTSTPSTTTTTTTSTTTTVVNVLANGNFSSGLTGWSNWGNAAVVNGALNVGTAAGGVGQDVWSKLTAGKNYQLTGSANVTVAGTEGVFVGVKLFSSTGALLLDKTQLVSATSATAVSLSFTMPSGVASGYVYVWKNANAAIGVVDNLVLGAV